MKKPLALLLVFSVYGLGAAEPPAKPMPADVKAMLEEHVGSWQTTGWISDAKGRKDIRASWECKRPGKGPGVQCVWHHEWPDGSKDTEFEMIGYDPESGKLRFTRLHEDGEASEVLVDVQGKVMSRRWEFEDDGKTAVGTNHIEVRAPGWWEQRVIITSDGKQVREMSLTQKRVATSTAPGS